jgi:hypothetical protein
MPGTAQKYEARACYVIRARRYERGHFKAVLKGFDRGRWPACSQNSCLPATGGLRSSVRHHLRHQGNTVLQHPARGQRWHVAADNRAGAPAQPPRLVGADGSAHSMGAHDDDCILNLIIRWLGVVLLGVAFLYRVFWLAGII